MDLLKADKGRKTAEEQAPGNVISVGVYAPRDNVTPAALSSHRKG